MVKRFTKRLIVLSLFLSLLSVLYFILVPDVSRLKKENPKKTALMEFREKQSKDKGRKLRIDQIWVPLSKISPYLSKSVLEPRRLRLRGDTKGDRKRYQDEEI
jgi:monofunctional biosynthetic peptidoglycan transglycosylase